MSEKVWLVYVLDRGREITFEIAASNKEHAKHKTKLLHPWGDVFHVEESNDHSALAAARSDELRGE